MWKDKSLGWIYWTTKVRLIMNPWNWKPNFTVQRYRFFHEYSIVFMVSKKAAKNNVPTTWTHWFENQYVQYLHHQLQYVNSSKIFAGLVVITLNIASKFVSIRLSKSMESYLKHTFSRDILIFCIVWMGSRDIYISLAVTLVFILCMDYLFNEDSVLCILPESFTSHHIDLIDNQVPSPEEIQQAKLTLKRAADAAKPTDESGADGGASAGNAGSAVSSLGSAIADSASASLVMRW